MMSSVQKWVVVLLLTGVGNVSYLVYRASNEGALFPTLNETALESNPAQTGFDLDGSGSADSESFFTDLARDQSYGKHFKQLPAPWRLDVPCNCQELLAGNETEIAKTLALNSQALSENVFDEHKLAEQTSNCSWLREQFSDSHFYISDFERQFPLAFSFVIHDNAHQILRLVQQLYRSHNSFCFHYDAKASYPFRKVFNNMANCLDNVIIPSKIEKIIWGTKSILEAQLNCIHDLHKLREWKYIITLCGKELPLLTNRQITTHLRAQHGRSVVHSTKVEENSIEMKRLRWRGALDNRGRIAQTKKALGPIPHNLTPYKNMAYMALSEPFVEYIFQSDTAFALRKFLAKCSNPEEHFYSMLYMQDRIPGGHDYSTSVAAVPWISETTWIPFKDIAKEYWSAGEQKLKRPVDYCRGIVIHRVCIVNSADLQHLVNLLQLQKKFFYNKYFMELDTTVMTCTEEWIAEQIMNEYQEDHSLL